MTSKSKIVVGVLLSVIVLEIGFGLYVVNSQRLERLNLTQHKPTPTPKGPRLSGKITIKVSVTVNDSYTTESQILSYVERELRSLGDVAIVKSLPDFQIDVVVTGINQGEKHIGSALSLVATDPYDDEETKILDHDLTVCGLNNLNEACRDLITNFDIQVLKPARLSGEFKGRLNPTVKP